MDADYGEATPPGSVKASLDQRLFSARDRASASERRPSRFWAFLVGQATGLVAAAIVFFALPLVGIGVDMPGDGNGVTEPGGAGRYVASMSPQQSDAAYVALFDGSSSMLNVTRVSGALPASGDHELWVIEGSNAPVSLGVLQRSAHSSMPMPEGHAAMLHPDATLAVSSEPAGGSPTGAPTGPVVSMGTLLNI